MADQVVFRPIFRSVTIGNYPIISLSEAREKGRNILRKASVGEFTDQQVNKPLTVEEVANLFIELHIKKNNRDKIENTPLSEVKVHLSGHAAERIFL